jgi:hypothetical protein
VTAAHVVAALRECYEESGVLVARDADGRPVHAHPEQAARLAAARAGVEGPGGAAAFVGILERERLWLDGSALRYFAHWITPVTSPIRFDARFFLAPAPEGAEPSPASGESVEGGWWAPGAALAAAAARQIKLPEPTEVTVRFLAQFGSCAALLAHCGDGTLKIQGTTHLIWPGGDPGLHRD